MEGAAAAAGAVGSSSPKVDHERELAKVAEAIADVEKAITEVGEKIKRVEEALEKGETYLGMAAARLLDHLSGLMEDKRQLREKELKLMDRQQPGHALADGSALKLLQEVHESLARKEKELTVAVSKASSRIWGEVQEKADLTRVSFSRKLAASRSGEMPLFKWTDGSEASHAAQYKAYLEERIGDLVDPRHGFFRLLLGNACPLDADALADVVGYKLHGTPDAVMVERSAKLMPQIGLRVVFELKKVVEKKNAVQAMLYLLLANWHASRLKPIVILTDLANDYTFYWLDDHTIYSYTPDDAASAWGLFDAILGSEEVSPAMLEGVVPKEGTDTAALPIAKRQRLVWGTPDAHADVANLADLEGCMDPEELRAARMGQLLQQFFALPFVEASREGWEGMFM